jgi:hypothetical protein
MSDAVDNQAAHTTNTFATIAVKGNGQFFAFALKFAIKHIKHLKKRHFRADAFERIRHHLAFIVWTLLTPDTYRKAQAIALACVSFASALFLGHL